VEGARDVPLLPGPEGDASGWTPAEAIVRNTEGDGWVLKGERARPAYERADIAYIDRASLRDALLRVRTADSPVSVGLRIDVHVSGNPVTARVILLCVEATEEVKRNAALFGKTYSLEEFFCRPEFMTWRTKYAYWSLYLAGPRDGARVRAIRIVPCGSGAQEHVLSLMKDFGVKPGESVDDIVLGRLNEAPTILSITLSPGEVTPREGSAGSATSRPAALDPSARRLEYLSWEEIPFDVGRGQMKVLVRTADAKYFIDRVAWTPVENGRTLAMPLGRYVQWRIEMTTKDPWRPPGASNLFFGLGRTDTARAAAGPSSRPPWLTLLLLVAAAAATAWLLVGRRSLWERRKRV
jgi:hypothetical protein